MGLGSRGGKKKGTHALREWYASKALTKCSCKALPHPDPVGKKNADVKTTLRGVEAL